MYEFNGTVIPYIANPSGTFTNARESKSVTITAVKSCKLPGQNVGRLVLNLSGDTAEWDTVHQDDEWLNGAGHEIRNIGGTVGWQTAIFQVGSLSGVNGAAEGWDESDVIDGQYSTSRTQTPDKVYTPVLTDYEFSPTTATLISAQGTGLYATFEETELDYKVTDPGPADDAEDVNRVTNLTWNEGDKVADSYKVYFGLVDNLVLVEDDLAPGEKTFDINDYSELSLGTEYEWRIDSYVSSVRVATGDIWSYTVRIQRTVVLSSPTNLSENNLTSGLTISWTIDGIGAQYGSFEDQDFLFIYIRKDDANFTEDDLVANFVQAFVNDDLSISRLHYGATYYWQVQAGNTAADLADSEVWSFDTLGFLPPTHSTREKLVYGEPGGPGDPGGDPGDPDVREYETIPSGENNMLTTRRLIAAAKNKIFYEDT